MAKNYKIDQFNFSAECAGRKGHDGPTGDFSPKHDVFPETKIQAVPQLGSATGRCGHCGRTTTFTGKPGTKVDGWLCPCGFQHTGANFTFVSQS
jgi:hypothetical protein